MTKLPVVRVSVRLPWPRAHAFDFVANPLNDSKWVDTTPELSQTNGHGLELGATYRFVQTVVREVEGEICVTEIIQNEFVEYRATDPFRDYKIEYRFQDAATGCKLTQFSHPTFKRSLGIKGPIVWLMIHRQLRRQMRALRRYMIENQAPDN